MSIRVFLVLLALCAASPAVASDAYDGGDKMDIPRPYKITAVKSLVITINGGWSDRISSEERPKDCKSFILTERDVREFFRHARHISYRSYYDDVKSRCYATGEVVFANGDHGQWKIDRSAEGNLTLSNNIEIYLECLKCSGKAYEWQIPPD